jgi:hypothetical protein
MTPDNSAPWRRHAATRLTLLFAFPALYFAFPWIISVAILAAVFACDAVLSWCISPDGELFRRLVVGLSLCLTFAMIFRLTEVSRWIAERELRWTTRLTRNARSPAS